MKIMYGELQKDQGGSGCSLFENISGPLGTVKIRLTCIEWYPVRTSTGASVIQTEMLHVLMGERIDN
jgi:hypothetical protein